MNKVMKRILEYSAAFLIAGAMTGVIIACVIYRAIAPGPKPEPGPDPRASALARETPFTLEDAEAIVRFADANGLEPRRVASEIMAGGFGLPDAFFRRPV